MNREQVEKQIRKELGFRIYKGVTYTDRSTDGTLAQKSRVASHVEIVLWDKYVSAMMGECGRVPPASVQTIPKGPS